MTTDTMRKKFEEIVSKTTFLGSGGLKIHESDQIPELTGKYKYKMAADLYEFFQAAYAQGQRDLIEAMGEPAAYIHHHKGGDNLEWDSQGVNYSPLYRLPEGTQK